VLTPQIAAVMVGEEFRTMTNRLLPWIALGAAASGIKAFHFDLAFHLGRDSRGLVICSSVAAATNVGFNLALIPRFGIVGAAYATVLAYLLGLFLSSWLGRRAFSMPPSWPIWLCAGSVALAVAVGAAVGGMLSSGFVGILAGIALGAVFGAIAAFVVNLSGIRSEMFSGSQVSLPTLWKTKRDQNDK
jgi:peptidoglycan biosynthesis protein MviN/MurJ (putative lipid II flippase)